METLSLSQIYKKLSAHREFITLAGTPCDEDCTQARHNLPEQIIECTALINQLRRIYGAEPEGVTFILIENYHDCGTYYEAGVIFNCQPEPDEYDFTEKSDYEIACNNFCQLPAERYAYQLEYLPENWDEEAITELRMSGHRRYQPARVIPIKKAS